MANKDQNKSDHSMYDPTDSNPDPITGQPGAHPVGTGIGAAGAGAVGATVGGVVAGPVGAVVGSVIGATVGGLMGKGAAESVNPTMEDAYWQQNYKSRSYVQADEPYENYQSAYRTGYEGYGRYAGTGRTYSDVEMNLRQDYETQHGSSGMGWEKAKHAVKDAWDRVGNAMPGGDRTDDRTVHQGISSDAHLHDADSVRLYEERLVADKHREKAGEVTLGKHVETQSAQVSVPLEKERVVIERVNTTDAGRPVAPGEAAFGGDAIHVEVYEETPEIHKEAFVREEVKVKKVVERDVVNATEEIRREELDLDTQGRPIVDGDFNK